MSDSLATPWTIAHLGSSVNGISQAGILDCHILSWEIFPTQESNPHSLHSLHWQVATLPLSWHQGSRVLCTVHQIFSPVVLGQGRSSPLGVIWQCLKFFFLCHNGHGGSGQTPAMLLNMLQCIGRFPTTKNYPTQSVSGDKVVKQFQSLQQFANKVLICQFGQWKPETPQ